LIFGIGGTSSQTQRPKPAASLFRLSHLERRDDGARSREAAMLQMLPQISPRAISPQAS
jgi:hypothetical protein